MGTVLSEDTKMRHGVKTRVPVHSDSTDTLALSIVKLPAIRPNQKILIFIAGGPGQSAIENIAYANQSMRAIQKNGTSCSSIKGDWHLLPSIQPRPLKSIHRLGTLKKHKKITKTIPSAGDTPIPLTYYGTSMRHKTLISSDAQWA